MRYSTPLAVALLGLSSTVYCAPVEFSPGSPGMHELLDCNAKQTEAIEIAKSDVSKMASAAYDLLNGKDWKKNKGYTHYFNEKDAPKVKWAFSLLRQTATQDNPISYYINCVPEGVCPDGDLASTMPEPESYSHGNTRSARRAIFLCPEFFKGEGPKRHFPTNDKEKKEYCKDHKKKKFGKFETGGTTLLHEITHLDSFGVLANFPEAEEKAEDGTTFKYHGTIDWKGGKTGEARKLKNADAKDRPETWQNAESLAASATEIYAMKECDDKDIGV